MTPAQLSTELRKMAAAIESSKNPSKVLVASALRKVIAKTVTSDEQYAAWKDTAMACWSAMKEAEKGMKECHATGDYMGAAKCAEDLHKATKDFAEKCEGNKLYSETMLSEMKEGSKKEGQPAHE